MPTFFVGSEDVTPPTIRIAGPLLQHLRASLRLQPGDELLVTDPQGRRHRSEITAVSAKAIESRILETSTAPPRTSPRLILYQALLKGEKMDWVIQKATELGIDQIVPVHAAHSVVKMQRDRMDHQLTRWQRIALEAAQQSERWTLSAIEAPVDLAKIHQTSADAVRIILSERSQGATLSSLELPTGAQKAIALLVGPEGGWEKEELRLALVQGWQAVSLGSRILRAETAAIAAISVIQSRLGELG